SANFAARNRSDGQGCVVSSRPRTVCMVAVRTSRDRRRQQRTFMNLKVSDRATAARLAWAFSACCATLAASVTSCSGPPTSRVSADADLGSVSLALGVGSNLTLDTVSYSITAPGFGRQGSLDLRNSTMVSGFIGGLPAATGYLIALAA